MNTKSYYIQVPYYCREVIKTLTSKGFSAFTVGGAVRDSILGNTLIDDWDVATSAQPCDVMGLFEHTIPTGIEHGTVTVLLENHSIEVTSFRKEYAYTDGRHPDSIDYIGNIKEDVKRRDFTINSLAYDPIDETLIDEFNGIEDIKDRIIRSVGNPLDRIREDRLRMLRAIRFSAQLGFDVERELILAIKKEHSWINRVSKERIRDEFIKIMLSPKPSIGINLMKDTGLLKCVIPELLDGVGVWQNRQNCKDVYEHNLLVCDTVISKINLRLAGLFHDIGKPVAENSGHFYNHEKTSVQKCKIILKRLRMDSKTIECVSHLIRHHMINCSKEWTDSAIRRFIKRVGKKYLSDLYELKKADIIGRGKNCEKYLCDLNHLYSRVRDLLDNAVLHTNELKIDGYDIMSLGIKEGPQIGYLLNHLLEIVVEDPEKNNREYLLEYAKDLLKTGEVLIK